MAPDPLGIGAELLGEGLLKGAARPVPGFGADWGGTPGRMTEGVGEERPDGKQGVGTVVVPLQLHLQGQLNYVDIHAAARSDILVPDPDHFLRDLPMLYPDHHHMVDRFTREPLPP